MSKIIFFVASVTVGMLGIFTFYGYSLAINDGSLQILYEEIPPVYAPGIQRILGIQLITIAVVLLGMIRLIEAINALKRTGKTDPKWRPYHEQ